jgi:plastocyanin
MLKKFAMLATVAALSLGVLAGCGGGAGTPIAISAGEGGALAFSPANLDLVKGTTYDLTFINKDTAQGHSFVLKDLNVNTGVIAAGQTKKITFTASKTGALEFDCDIAGHKDGGMHGIATVK